MIDRFIKEVEYAYENVPFYKKKLDEKGVSPLTLDASNLLQELPFTNKKDYRVNFPLGVLAKGFSINHPMLTKSQSSGTSGERLVTFEIGMNLLQRAVECARAHPVIFEAFTKPGRKICRYAAPNCSDVECANPNSTMEDRRLADGTLVLPVYHDLLTTTKEMIDRTIEEIEVYKPDLFYVDPTHFAFLIRQYENRKLTPPAIPVVTSYSAASAISRKYISRYYPESTLFSELFSSSEMGWLAMRCPEGHIHLNDESFFIELIAPTGIAEGASHFYELCVSSIDQGALPHLRYRSGDIVSVSETQCSCAHGGRIVQIEGRESHFLKRSNEGLISPANIDRIVGAPEWMQLYRLEQMNEDRFVLQMIVEEKYHAGNEQDIVRELAALLEADVQFEVVDYIPSDRSGKFQYIKRSP